MTDENGAQNRQPNFTQMDRLCVFGAPLILIAVALLQIVLTQSHGLTRWKGGGFGMFSTLDSPSARFLRIYLQTPEGEFPVEIPSDLFPLGQKIQAIPSRADLRRLASRLAESTWIDGQPAVQYPHGSITAVDSILQQEAPRIDPPGGMADQPRFRALERGEPAETISGPVVQGVRVELWRYRGDTAANALVAEQILVESAVVAGPPAGK